MVQRLVSILVLGAALVGCAGKDLAPSTRTGKIHDVRIGQDLNPKQVSVRVGDEVRWINSRSAPVKIVFVDSLSDKLVCQNSFRSGRLMSMFSDEAGKLNVTTIEPNEYASLCFASSGSYVYNVRMESTAAGGEANTSGTVLVE